ncbi:MAG: hypothetical protein DRQ44_09945 [Gammaproteobacteria bacterium]|nr:MAG: hypothetical protein DRQ44_09945 [Gammaproteobacteria bacterium]
MATIDGFTLAMVSGRGGVALQTPNKDDINRMEEQNVFIFSPFSSIWQDSRTRIPFPTAIRNPMFFQHFP